MNEEVALLFSVPVLNGYKFTGDEIMDAISSRNAIIPGGTFRAEGQNFPVQLSGEFQNEDELLGTIVSVTKDGTPVYLRDVFEVRRGDENPIPYSVEVLHRSKQTLAPALSLSERKREKNIQRLDKTERGETTDRLENVLPLPRRGGEGRGEGAALSDSAPLTPARSVLLAIEMKEGNIIGQFNETIRTVLDAAGSRLPEGMEIISLSDQPASVAHRIHHFMRWFIEAVIVVVLVALFLMDWRSALVVATAIPLTVAMTFGGMALLGTAVDKMSTRSADIPVCGSGDFPVASSEHGTGMSGEPAGWKACATS